MLYGWNATYAAALILLSAPIIPKFGLARCNSPPGRHVYTLEMHVGHPA